MADRLTKEEWTELARLSNRARFDPTTSERSEEVLLNVSLYGSRRGGN